MRSATASERIQSPVERVFAFMNEPGHQAEITPSMVFSRETGRMPNGGARAEYAYKMAGMTFRGTVEAVEFVPNERIVFAMQGDIEGTIRWSFTPEGDAATRVEYAANYGVPGSLLAKLAEPVVASYNERELRSTLANLRERLEE